VGDDYDLGWWGSYVSSGNKYCGLARKAGGQFALFDGLTTIPSATSVGTVSSNYANLNLGKLDLTKATTPALYFGGDSSTGLLSNATNEIAMNVAGSPSTTWNSSGVGITGALDVSGEIRGSSLLVDGGGASSSGWIFDGGLKQRNTHPVIITGAFTSQSVSGSSFAGNLGVGGTPEAKLDVIKSHPGTDLSSTLYITNSFSLGSGTRATDLTFRLTDSVGTEKESASIQALSNNQDISNGAVVVPCLQLG
jgi:hypothetical protein